MKIALAAALATGLIGVTGCKINEDDVSALEEGESFELGELHWNALYDRFLNSQQVEDANYAGSLGPPSPGTQYFGVFVLVDNKTEDPQPLPDISSFKISDSTGADYAPIPSEGAFEFPYGGTIEPHAQIPDPDSTAANGPVQGALLLFELSQDVTENRPLQLHIRSAGEEAVIKLDL
jgi:hypothetical protein